MEERKKEMPKMEPKIAARFLNSQSEARICPFVRGVVPRLRPHAGCARDDILKVWQCERSAKQKKNTSFRIATDLHRSIFSSVLIRGVFLERVFYEAKGQEVHGNARAYAGPAGVDHRPVAVRCRETVGKSRRAARPRRDEWLRVPHLSIPQRKRRALPARQQEDAER